VEREEVDAEVGEAKRYLSGSAETVKNRFFTVSADPLKSFSGGSGGLLGKRCAGLRVCLSYFCQRRTFGFFSFASSCLPAVLEPPP
jgi:hypothetical protein